MAGEKIQQEENIAGQAPLDSTAVFEKTQGHFETAQETPAPAPLPSLQEGDGTAAGQQFANHQAAPITPEEVQRIVLKLSPEPHDRQMEELVTLAREKGIKNALAVVEKLNNPHLGDDFHRFVGQYVREGNVIKASSKDPMYDSLMRTVFEISLPKKENENKPLKELLSSMEQLYASLAEERAYVVFEIVNPVGVEMFSMYASVPQALADRFEKQCRSIFPGAELSLSPNDHNVFVEGGYTECSSASLERHPALPLRLYESFDSDPMNLLLAAFSKLEAEGEAACIQVLVGPPNANFTKEYRHKMERLEKGGKVSDVLPKPKGFLGTVFREISGAFSSSKKKDDKGKDSMESKVADQGAQRAMEAIERKLSRPVSPVTLRLVASSKGKNRSSQILSDMEAALRQFNDQSGNSLAFKRVKPADLKRFARAFSFRIPGKEDIMPLNLAEITGIFHFHTEALAVSHELKTVKSRRVPAPAGLSTTGVVLGVNNGSGVEKEVRIADEDRLRHMYFIGQTGTGKSTLIKHMAVQDVLAGKGICMIDPHGSDIQEVLASVPPERMEDVVYFDPADTERPMALNMLEYDINRPEQKTFVVNELFSIFQKLYGGTPESMGPMFEQYFRNATMLVIEDPETGCTLLDVSRVMSNKEFRQLKLSRCKNPIVVQFWREIAEKAGGEGKLENMVPYITSKFDVFLANDIMRPIVTQEKSSINLREIMDNKKIFLVNLSKGRLGDINANLIGLIIVGKILMAALSRVDMKKEDIEPFYLYIDEFQNITTNSISTILSEARKYKLSLTVAHQFISQLEEDIKNAVFGNVGSMVAFRVGNDDAEYLAKQFAPSFAAEDLANLENGRAALRLLSQGSPLSPFDVTTRRWSAEKTADISAIKKLSALKYGRPRAEVEEEISKKFSAIQSAQQ